MSQFDPTAPARPNAAVRFVAGEPGPAGHTRVLDGGSLASSTSLDLAGEHSTLLLGLLTTDITITVTNIEAGATLQLILTQDAVGGHSVTLSDGTDTLVLPVNAAAGQATLLTCISPNGHDILVKP